MVREQVDSSSAASVRRARVRPAADGLAAWFDGPVRLRDPDRAAASPREPLTPTLLACWQKLVLGVNEVRLRQSDALAKGGRERYGLTRHIWQDFAACLHVLDLPMARRGMRQEM
jgi:hypothetical protein